MNEPTTVDESNLPNLHVDWYEAVWIRISLFVLVIFLLAVIAASSAFGIQVPGAYARIKPDEIMAPGSPFAEPGVRELAPDTYEAYLRAATWSFTPSEIRVPAGATVTFYITSLDVQHGFKIMDTNINMMVLPGQISTLKTQFDTPGTYNMICHEYCGAANADFGHHTMYGQIIVEDPTAASPVQ